MFTMYNNCTRVHVFLSSTYICTNLYMISQRHYCYIYILIYNIQASEIVRLFQSIEDIHIKKHWVTRHLSIKCIQQQKQKQHITDLHTQKKNNFRQWKVEARKRWLFISFNKKKLKCECDASLYTMDIYYDSLQWIIAQFLSFVCICCLLSLLSTHKAMFMWHAVSGSLLSLWRHRWRHNSLK